MRNEFIVGMDLGGTFLKYALGTSDGELIYVAKMPSKGDATQAEIFEVIFEAIEDVQKQARDRNGEILALGFGSPGAVDFDQGRLLGNTPNLPHWGNANIRGQISGRFNIPTFADNDANVMVLAEATRGAAKGHKNVIGITIGTGIGGGIIIDGKIYRGHNYAGAELGHVSIDYNGLPCNCGGVGCIEQYASAPGIVRNYLEKLPKKAKNPSALVTTEMIFERARQGEEEATETIDDTCLYLGTALSGFANIFNPEIIVIGGGVADAGEDFLKRIWNVMEARTMKTILKGLGLVGAELGNTAGMVGAISLAAQSYQS